MVFKLPNLYLVDTLYDKQLKMSFFPFYLHVLLI